MTLTEFIAVRLDDDQAAIDKVYGRWRENAAGYIADESYGGALVIAGRVDKDSKAFILRFNPERVLRQVTAMRAIVALHQRNEHRRPDLGPDWPVRYYCDCQCPDGVIEGEWPCEHVRALAAVWSDHPDYDPGWKP